MRKWNIWRTDRYTQKQKRWLGKKEEFVRNKRRLRVCNGTDGAFLVRKRKNVIEKEKREKITIVKQRCGGDWKDL